MKLVAVTWVDAQGSAEWHDIDTLDLSLPVVHTVGWLLAETDDALILAGDRIDKSRQVNSVSWIPKQMIRRRRIIREA